MLATHSVLLAESNIYYEEVKQPVIRKMSKKLRNIYFFLLEPNLNWKQGFKLKTNQKNTFFLKQISKEKWLEMQKASLMYQMSEWIL